MEIEDDARFEKIQNVAAELDQYMFSVSEKNGLTASQLNGIFLARLMRLNIECGNEKNFFKLLEVILQRDHEQWDENRSIH